MQLFLKCSLLSVNRHVRFQFDFAVNHIGIYFLSNFNTLLVVRNLRHTFRVHGLKHWWRLVVQPYALQAYVGLLSRQCVAGSSYHAGSLGQYECGRSDQSVIAHMTAPRDHRRCQAAAVTRLSPLKCQPIVCDQTVTTVPESAPEQMFLMMFLMSDDC